MLLALGPTEMHLALNMSHVQSWIKASKESNNNAMGTNPAVEVPCMTSEEEAWLNRLKGVDGIVVAKFGKRGKPRKKRLILSDDLQVLRWKSLFKSREKTSVLIMDVTRITIGQKTR